MTEHPEVFNRYDIRGDYPEEIDEEFAERLGRSVATYAIRNDVDTVVIGKDTRDNSDKVFEALKEGVKESQIELIDVGIGTTDRTALAAEFYGGVGIMVTASHHSWDRTGFKLIYKEGYGFSNEDLGEVKEIYLNQDFDKGGGGKILNMESEFDERYVERMESFVEDLGSDTGKIVMDCCNGGTFKTAPWIFERKGFEVVELNCESGGREVDPEPKASNREYLVEAVEEKDADIGFSYDPDGDRVFVYHPEIGWIDGNYVFYALANIIDAEKIAASIDTAGFLESLEADIQYSRVGDVFVSAEGWSMDSDLLGEPNGHFAVTDFCWYNSGILSSLLLALNHSRIKSILEDAPEIFTEKESYILDESTEKGEVVKKAIKYAKKNYEVVSIVDGVKFKGEGFESLVRPSGTSQKIRLIVNGSKKSRVQEIKRDIEENCIEGRS